MNKQGYMGSLEFFVLFSICNVLPYFYSLPAIMGEKAATGAWLLNIGAGLLGCLLFLPMCYLLKRFPGLSIIDIGERVLGTFGRFLVTIALGGISIWLMVIESGALASAISTTVLPRTPVSANLGLIFLVAGIISYLGLEAISRTAFIFSPFILLGFVTIIVTVLPQLDMSGIYPILGVPLKQHLISSVQLSPVIYQAPIIGIFAPYVRQGRSILGTVIWSILFTTIITTGLIIVVELSFPYPGISLIPYPILQVAKMVHIGRFIERIEAVFIIMAIVAILIRFAAVFHIGVMTLAQGLKIPDWRPLIFPLVTIGYALSLLPQSGTDIAAMVYSWVGSLAWWAISVGLPLTIMSIALIRGKKGEKTGAGQSR